MATNTSQGQGQGLAQVLDPSRAYNEFIKGQEDAMQRGLAEKGKRDEAAKNAFKGVSDLADADIWFRDAPYFQKKLNETTSWLQENVDRVSSGDPEAVLEFENMKAAIKNDAMKSMQFKESFDKRSNILMQDKDKNFDYNKGLEDLQKELDPSMAGNFDYDPTGRGLFPKEQQVDLTEYIRTNVLPLWQAAKNRNKNVNENEEGVTTSTMFEGISENDARNILLESLSNPVIFAQVQKDFENLPPEDKLKYEGAEDYYFDRFKAMIPGSKSEESTTREGEGGGLEFNFGGSGASNSKYRIDFIEKEVSSLKGVKSIQAPNKKEVIAEINDVKNKSDLSPLDINFKNKRSVKSVPIEAVKRGGNWFIRFSMTETDADSEEIKKGKVFDKPWEEVSQEIIGKYGIDIPQLYDGWKNQSTEAPSYEDLN